MKCSHCNGPIVRIEDYTLEEGLVSELRCRICGRLAEAQG